ncbi:MAG: hypothetical protein AAFX50_21165, partial [Acidobacteriota bacterium]
MPTYRFSLIFVLSLFLTAVVAAEDAADTEDPTSIAVTPWLVLDAAPLAAPAFSEDSADLLQGLTLAESDLWPAEGRTAHFPPGRTATWRAATAPLDLGTPDGPRALWLATVLTADRFIDANLEVTSGDLLRVWVNGEEAAIQKEAGDEPTEASATLALDAGSHRVLVLAVRDAEAPSETWTVGAHLEVTPELAAAVSFGTQAERRLAIDDLLEPPRAQSVDVAPGGDLIAVTFRRPAAPSEGGESWVDILTEDGEVIRTLRQSPSSFAWSPKADGTFAYLVSAGGAQQ